MAFGQPLLSRISSAKGDNLHAKYEVGSSWLGAKIEATNDASHFQFVQRFYPELLMMG